MPPHRYSVLMFPKALSWVLFGLPCTCFLLGVVSQKYPKPCHAENFQLHIFFKPTNVAQFSIIYHCIICISKKNKKRT